MTARKNTGPSSDRLGSREPRLQLVPRLADPECELAIEVIVLWGEGARDTEVLHVGYADAERGFSVGDATFEDGALSTDYAIDAAQLGTSRLQLIDHGEHGDHGPMLRVPLGASLHVVADSGQARSAAQLLLDGALCPLRDPAAPYALPLARGVSAWLSHRGFTFVVRATEREQLAALAPKLDWQAQRYTALSVAAHLFLLALFYYSPPKSSAMTSDEGAMRRDYIDFMLTAKELDLQPLPVFEHGDGSPSDSETAPAGESGTLGEPTAQAPRAPKTQRRTGPVQLSREEARALALDAGIVRTLANFLPNADGVFDAAGAGGDDAVSALFDPRALTDGPSFGRGLGPAGTGRGGGGDAEGTIAAGHLRTVDGRGPGTGGSRYGVNAGGLQQRRAHVPSAIARVVEVAGGLSKEAIRRTIARRLNEVRFCYEQALQSRPDLQGRVVVRFIIGPSGAVQQAAAVSSDLAQPATATCIADAVKRWNFDAPSGSGIVSVTYPFVLQQVGS